MQRDSTKTLLKIGLGSILGLMFLVAMASLSMLHSSSAQIKQVVSDNNLKFELIYSMRAAARERTINLQNMIILEDPFKQDEQWMLINANGAEFAKARQKLLSLDLSPDELGLLDEQSILTGAVGPLQLRIAELVLSGEKTQAFALLESQAIPGQNQTFQLLSKLLDLQKDSAEKAVRTANLAYRNTLISILGLLLGLGILSLLIARHLLQRTSETEARLQSATERAKITLHSIGDGVITTDTQGLIEQLNPEAERLTGWSARNAVNQPIAQVFAAFHETTARPIADPVSLTLKKQRVITSEADVLIHARSGRKFSIEYTVAPIFDQTNDTLMGTILVVRDVTQLRVIAKELAYQAKHDMLTGLMNRRAFEHHLEIVMERIPEQTDEPHWLCYLDLDQFKLINDTCGHLAGDELLKKIARTLQVQIRDVDLLARMGGDEFAILLNRCTADDAAQTIERIRQAIASMPFSWASKSFGTSGSFGLIPITQENSTLYELMSAADTACYVAKDDGRNRIHIYSSGDGATARRTGEMHWVQRIKQALAENRFVLYHQPIAALQGTVYSVHSEILVRMLDEDNTIIPPMSFIPAAERYNLMADIDRWVVHNALHALRETMLSAAPGTCTIAINLSAQSLCDDSFLPYVLRELDTLHFDPHHLCFEITETCAISNLSRAIHFMSTLRTRGCRFALDDFGSGLSSFSYLKNLSVEYLKIDGSFVRDIEHDAMDLAMVDSINQIGHVAGTQTIAEYVENTAILEKLRRLGVDFAQGYGIARPEPLHFLISSIERQQAKVGVQGKFR